MRNLFQRARYKIVLWLYEVTAPKVLKDIWKQKDKLELIEAHSHSQVYAVIKTKTILQIQDLHKQAVFAKTIEELAFYRGQIVALREHINDIETAAEQLRQLEKPSGFMRSQPVWQQRYRTGVDKSKSNIHTKIKQ